VCAALDGSRDNSMYLRSSDNDVNMLILLEY
jgi:hypothetical protein